MIMGPLNATDPDWKYRGRPREKGFFYEIVSNDRNKVDVDKWDYFARDCHHLGIKNSFDHKRFMKFLKVLPDGKDMQICQRDKEYMNLHELFHVRCLLHRRAYQHRICSAIDEMICDAMVLANDQPLIFGKDGKKLKISETINDMFAFEKLTDNIFYQILHSEDRSAPMEAARKILNRILCRDFYKQVGNFKPNANQTRSQVEAEIAELVQDKDLEKDDIAVNERIFDYGMKKENPLDHFRFYSKDKPDTPDRIPAEKISDMLPRIFQDRELQVFCKDSAKRQKAKEYFEIWRGKNGI
ncbi:deoxynucleoside triphosphate triphosphohydrolase SAMHD1-like [Clavelina lepadiformis]|uniref:deoxynucleoside triphosphate triphosphohydrolase SAMHD1-like n=1 Tax=Clavelina lepadiformis TaxID=159417 RepID=UPI004042DB82